MKNIDIRAIKKPRLLPLGALFLGLLTTSTWSQATTTTFTNSNYISIPDESVVISNLNVDLTGISGPITGFSVTLNGFYHDIPDDVEIILFNPSGRRVTLMDFAVLDGQELDVSISGTLNLTFSDDAPQRYFTDTGDFGLSDGVITETEYRPLGFPIRQPMSADFYESFTGAFLSSQLTGTWSLYVQDMAEEDVGFIQNGWSLNFTTSAVPEPATSGLVLGGLALSGCICVRRRRA